MSTVFMTNTWRVAPLTPTRVDTPMGSIAISWRSNNDGGAIERAAEDAARLIAAAPDLLAELRNMVRWCGHRGEVLGEDKLLPINQQPPEVQSAMRAIANAEGEHA